MKPNSTCKYNCYMLGTAKNCGAYIKNTINVLKQLGSVFNSYCIIIAYDESTDNTLSDLQSSKIEFEKENISFEIIMCNNNSDKRTRNISNARNSLLNAIKTHKKDDYLKIWKYFIVIDCDDVSAIGNIKTNILSYYLNRSMDWDSLSFNRNNYYDIWALSFDDYMWSCWGFKDKSKNLQIVETMKQVITKKLKDLDRKDLLSCYSAFNGLAIYKVDKFIDCKYDYNPPKYLIDLIDPDIIRRNEILVNDKIGFDDDCEHRHFHLQSIVKNKAKIRISPLNIFDIKEPYTLFNYISVKNIIIIIILLFIVIVIFYFVRILG